jgi:hypothetical protein
MATRQHLSTATGFIVRLVLYAIGIAIALAIARIEWGAFGLDAVANGTTAAAARIARWHDRLPVTIALSAVLLAALGAVWRHLATLLLWALLGAIVSAPFFISRALGG